MDWFPYIAPVISALIGFVTGWGLFELTEWRRRVARRRELRSALIAELKNGEVMASVNVGKYARYFRKTPEKVAIAAKEIRWILLEGHSRMQEAAVLAALPELNVDINSIDDNALVAVCSGITETLGNKMTFPVVEGVLAGNLSGLSAQQIGALGMVQWNAHLLSQDADAMLHFLTMTFTVTDDNHPKILENHDRRSAAYAQRSEVLLRVIRRAIELLEAR